MGHNTKHEDKCSNCGSTETKMFHDFEDGSVLCDKCNKQLGHKWESINKKKRIIHFFKKNKIVFAIIGILLTLIVLGFVVKATLFTCPSSCDDGLKCTTDFCSSETKYKCTHKDIIPCVGNNNCEQGEYGTNDCQNCDDNNKCTKDNINYETKQCIHEDIIPCVGNGKCESGEYGAADCPNCDDSNKCTLDGIDYGTLKCSHEPIIPCCGNNKAETGETCSSCQSDVKCSSEMLCCYGECKNICKSNTDCVSDDPAKVGTCNSANTCNAYCSYETSPTAEIKGTTYTTHGLKFDAVLDEYGNKISYYDKSGEIAYVGAQDGMKLLKYKVTVQCVDESCESFYSSSFQLMDVEGNTYEAQCPIDLFYNCKNRDELNSMYDALKGQKTSGLLMYSIPRSVDTVSLIYKFSSYKENPKILKFTSSLN